MSVLDVWKNADDTAPVMEGWYPTLWVMPGNEGIMPGCSEWRNGVWSVGRVDYFINQIFDTAAEAKAVAYQNDAEDSQQ